MEIKRSKIKKPLLRETTHPAVFVIPVVIFIIMVTYFINYQLDENIYISILILLGITAKCGLLYYKKKLIITDKSIYVYIRGEKFIAWSFVEDFYMINYHQNFLGKIFDYGTLVMINNKKEMYEYHYLRNPKEAYLLIIKTYEILMKKLDPTFIVSYINNNTQKIDNIEDEK